MHNVELSLLHILAGYKSLFGLQLRAEAVVEAGCVSLHPIPGAQMLSPEAKEVLAKLVEVNDLDLARLIIAEAVGDSDTVAALKAWLSKKAERKAELERKTDSLDKGDWA